MFLLKHNTISQSSSTIYQVLWDSDIRHRLANVFTKTHQESDFFILNKIYKKYAYIIILSNAFNVRTRWKDRNLLVLVEY